jgi:multiple sugar transport system substrate-binding protein
MRKGERIVQPDNSARLLLGGAAALLSGLLLTACGSGAPGGPVLNLYAWPQQHRADIIARCNQQAHGRYTIKLNLLPRTTDQAREQVVRRLAAGDSGADILGIDVTWTAELAEAGWIREWTGSYKQRVEQGTLAAPLAPATVNGHLYAAPNTTNVQLLWRRSDLVPTAPRTWNEVIATAEALKRQGKPHYVEVTGAQYEGLVVWFNELVMSAGGSILNGAGVKASLGRPGLIALDTMKRFATSAAADPSLSNTTEDMARLAVEGGTAAMEINWPYVYAAMAANKPEMLKNFTWAAVPGIDGPGRATIGGENLAIGKFSKYPDLAFEAALCLRNAENQKYSAIFDGVPPTIESVYYDDTPVVHPGQPADARTNPSMATAYPMRAAILAEIKNAAIRPVTATYQNVSMVIAATLSPPSSIDPLATLKALQTQITDALESRGVLP